MPYTAEPMSLTARLTSTSDRTDPSEIPFLSPASTFCMPTSSWPSERGRSTEVHFTASKAATNIARRSSGSSAASWPIRSKCASACCRPLASGSRSGLNCATYSRMKIASSTASLLPYRAWTMARLYPARRPISAAVVASQPFSMMSSAAARASLRLEISTRSGCVRPRLGEGTLAY